MTPDDIREAMRPVCRGSIRLGTDCGSCKRCVYAWRNRLIGLRSDLLAALLECHDYDSLYARGMELLDEYDPVRPTEKGQINANSE